jgi:ABC-type transport system involved in multi-copper enzyme maturation permease subunit
MIAAIYAEWTKYWTVRGWVIGMLIAILATLGVGLLGHESGSGSPLPLGPGGEAVNDTFYFVRQPLAGNGSLTVRVTSLTGLVQPGSGRVRAGQSGQPPMVPGLQPWSKVGLIVKASTSQGSAYAAMMVTGGHGVRMQYDYTQDTPGPPGAVSPASPRWLRLVRSGDTITGYDSPDGAGWTRVGTATLPGLPATVQAGLFAASPLQNRAIAQSLGGSSHASTPTLATGTFDHVQGLPGTWAGMQIGGGPTGTYPTAAGGYQQAGGRLTVTGSGDISPAVPGGDFGANIGHTLIGTFAGLIAVVVVAAMFITAEYRRGLIRTTFAASPRRGRVLAAKAAVIGGIAFAAGLAGAGIGLPLGTSQLRASGVFIDPVTALTLIRLVVGTAGLLAVAAVLALAIGTILRSSAVAVTTVIVAVILPYILATFTTSGFTQWLLRVTPAAGFAIQQAYPRYPQVDASYTIVGGYYPLPPWAGLAVLCAWAAAALALAAARLLGHVIRLNLARGQAACSQRPILQRVDVEHEQPARADEPPDLREHRAGHLVGKHVQGDVGHDRVEAPVGEGKPPGRIGHQEPGQRPEPGQRLPDGLARHIDRGDRVALAGQPGGIVAGSASQLKDGPHARLPQRGQERPGPQARPVQVIAGLPALPEELVPELSTRIGHPVTLRRTGPRTGPVRRGHQKCCPASPLLRCPGQHTAIFTVTSGTGISPILSVRRPRGSASMAPLCQQSRAYQIPADSSR